jgi:hypothetical protein
LLDTFLASLGLTKTECSLFAFLSSRRIVFFRICAVFFIRIRVEGQLTRLGDAEVISLPVVLEVGDSELVVLVKKIRLHIRHIEVI